MLGWGRGGVEERLEGVCHGRVVVIIIVVCTGVVVARVSAIMVRVIIILTIIKILGGIGRSVLYRSKLDIVIAIG